MIAGVAVAPLGLVSWRRQPVDAQTTGQLVDLTSRVQPAASQLVHSLLQDGAALHVLQV